MSLEHLFQHIISSERRARESRRWMQEGAGAPGHCGAFALCSGGLGAEGPQAVVGAPRGEGGRVPSPGLQTWGLRADGCA